MVYFYLNLYNFLNTMIILSQITSLNLFSVKKIPWDRMRQTEENSYSLPLKKENL